MVVFVPVLSVYTYMCLLGNCACVCVCLCLCVPLLCVLHRGTYIFVFEGLSGPKEPPSWPSALPLPHHPGAPVPPGRETDRAVGGGGCLLPHRPAAPTGGAPWGSRSLGVQGSQCSGSPCCLQEGKASQPGARLVRIPASSE